LTKCLKCGKCCVVFDGKNWVDCKYLTNTKLCSIYRDRIGKKLGYGFICARRKDLHFNIPKCPYNKKKWKAHPFYK